MAHLQKFTKASTGHLFYHYGRLKNERGEYVKFRNENIDTNRTELNYNLAPAGNQQEILNKRLSEIKVQNRADVNVMCSWVLTAPKELPVDKVDEFFKESYKFLENRYGKENVISAYVHLDEVSPHLHFSFVPVVEDKKKGGFKLSAKERVDRSDLKSFHSDLQKTLDFWRESKGYEFECNVLNGATEKAGGNKSIENLKAEKFKVQNQQLEEKLEVTESKLKSAQAEVKVLKKVIKKADSELSELEENDDVKVRRTILGKSKVMVKMSEETYDSINDGFANIKGAEKGFNKATEVLNNKVNELEEKIEDIHIRELEVYRDNLLSREYKNQTYKVLRSTEVERSKVIDEKENYQHMAERYSEKSKALQPKIDSLQKKVDDVIKVNHQLNQEVHQIADETLATAEKSFSVMEQGVSNVANACGMDNCPPEVKALLQSSLEAFKLASAGFEKGLSLLLPKSSFKALKKPTKAIPKVKPKEWKVEHRIREDKKINIKPKDKGDR